MLTRFFKGFKNQALDINDFLFENLKYLIKFSVISTQVLILIFLYLLYESGDEKKLNFKDFFDFLHLDLYLSSLFSGIFVGSYFNIAFWNCVLSGIKEMLRSYNATKISLPNALPSSSLTFEERLEALQYNPLEEKDAVRRLILDLITDPIFYTVMNHPVGLNTGTVMDLTTIKTLLEKNYHVNLFCPITQKKVTRGETNFSVMNMTEKFIQILEKEYQKEKPKVPNNYLKFYKKPNDELRDAKLKEINQPKSSCVLLSLFR